MKTFNHLIAKHGVLISFSIAKKLSRDHIKSITKEINKLGGDKKTRDLLIEEEVKRNAMDTMKLTDIPGLILDKSEILREKNLDNSFMKDEKKVITLIILANAVSKKILEKKLPKEQMCFVLISLINSLGLSDFDFKNFHQKHNPNYEEEEEEFDEEDDNDDGEYED